MTPIHPNHGLACPTCGERLDVVKDSRKYPDYIRRRRVCSNGHRHSTHEVFVERIEDADNTKSTLRAVAVMLRAVESELSRETEIVPEDDAI